MDLTRPARWNSSSRTKREEGSRSNRSDDVILLHPVKFGKDSKSRLDVLARSSSKQTKPTSLNAGLAEAFVILFSQCLPFIFNHYFRYYNL